MVEVDCNRIWLSSMLMMGMYFGGSSRTGEEGTTNHVSSRIHSLNNPTVYTTTNTNCMLEKRLL